MTDDKHLQDLLRRALPASARQPSRDLWPSVAERMDTPVGWSVFDISLAVGVGIALFLFPEALWFLAYHL